MASIIQCCRYCVPPKRYPGCHAICPEYRSEKALHDAKKAEIEKIKAIQEGLDSQVIAGVERAKKIRKGGG